MKSRPSRSCSRKSRLTTWQVGKISWMIIIVPRSKMPAKEKVTKRTASKKPAQRTTSKKSIKRTVSKRTAKRTLGSKKTSKRTTGRLANRKPPRVPRCTTETLPIGEWRRINFALQGTIKTLATEIAAKDLKIATLKKAVKAASKAVLGASSAAKKKTRVERKELSLEEMKVGTQVANLFKKEKASPSLALLQAESKAISKKTKLLPTVALRKKWVAYVAELVAASSPQNYQKHRIGEAVERIEKRIDQMAREDLHEVRSAAAPAPRDANRNRRKQAQPKRRPGLSSTPRVEPPAPTITPANIPQ
jgi:hypothetical protein